MLDQAEIAFAPGDTPNSWKVHVLDIITTEVGREIHNKELSFRTKSRPAARYMYFRFATNILLRQRYEAEGWWGRGRIDFGGQEMWATPERYLRKSTLTTWQVGLDER